MGGFEPRRTGAVDGGLGAWALRGTWDGWFGVAIPLCPTRGRLPRHLCRTCRPFLSLSVGSREPPRLQYRMTSPASGPTIALTSASRGQWRTPS